MPSYGTFGQMMIDVGVNLSSLGAGLNAAKGQLASFNVIGSQVASNLGSSFGGTALKIGVVAGAIYAVQSAFAAAIAAADEYRLGIVNIASTLYDMLDKPIRTQKDFNDLLAYSKEMYKELELEAVKHFASGKDLQLAWMILTQKGVQLRYEEINALGIIVDKIKLITQGQISTIQITQEIRSMLNGQARVTDQLAILLHSKYGVAWKEIVQTQRQSGTLLIWLSKEFEGLAMAQKYIYETIEAQSTTLWTMIRRVGRDGLLGAYEYIVAVLKKINEYLFEHENIVSAGVAAAWASMEPAITAVGQAIQSLIIYLWENGEAIGAMSLAVSNFIVWVIQAIQWVAAWTSEHRGLILAVLSLWAAYKVVTILGTIIVTLKGLVIALGEAFGITTLAGISMSAMIPVIGTIIAIIGLATFAAFSLGKVLDDTIEKAKLAQYHATRMRPEMARESYENYAKSPEFKRRFGAQLAKSGIEKVAEEQDVEFVAGLAKNAQKQEEYAKKIEKLNEERVKSQEEIVQQTQAGFATIQTETKITEESIAATERATQAKKDATEQATKFGLVIDWSTKKIGSALEPADIRLIGDQEKKQWYEATMGDKKFLPGGGEKEKKGKGPEKLLGGMDAEAKARRAFALQVLKDELAIMEKRNELNVEEWENKLSMGQIKGQEYINLVEDQDKKTLAAKLAIIEGEKQADKDLYDEKKKNIAEEIARDALSPEKARLKYLVAELEMRKQLEGRKKEAVIAELEAQKKLQDQLKKDIQTKMEMLTTSMSTLASFAWGPVEERAAKIMNIQKEYADLSKKIADIGIGEKGAQISPEFRQAIEGMVTFADVIGTPWAKEFAEGARMFLEAKTKEDAEAAKLRMTGALPAMKEEMIWRAKYQQMFTAIADDFSNGMMNIFESIRNGGKDLQQVITNMLDSIMKDTLKPGFEALGKVLSDLLRQLINSAAGTMGFSIPGFGGSSFTGTELARLPMPEYGAKGGAWYHGVRQAFGSGGIFTRPTVFAMAGGMGLMGEAGPEAVMPLVRLPGGNLGVQSSGDRQGVVSIIVNNNAPNAQAKADQGPSGDFIITVEEIVSKAYARHGKLYKMINAGSRITHR